MTRLQRMSLLGLAAVGSLMANVAMAASSLQDLNFTALGGDRMELKLDFVGGVASIWGSAAWTNWWRWRPARARVWS